MYACVRKLTFIAHDVALLGEEAGSSSDESEVTIDEELCGDDIFVESKDEIEDNPITAPRASTLTPLMRSVLLFLMLWQITFNVSDTGKIYKLKA